MFSTILDKTDIAAFARDGVVCLRQVINPKRIADLTVALDELAAAIPGSRAGYDVTKLRRNIWNTPVSDVHDGVAQQHDFGAITAAIKEAGAEALVERGAEDRGHFLLDTSTWRRNEVVRELALDSSMPGIAAQLMHANKINYCDDQIFIKPPRTIDRTAFHQDYTYFRMRGLKGCVMWICVDPADEKAGGIAYVRGSHRWETEFLPNVFMAQVSMPGGRGASLRDVEENSQDFDIVRYETKPGDVIIHHFLTVHGAGGNTTDSPRRALSLRYAAEDMVFYPRPGAPEQPYHSHALTEGDPLDSRDFPVVWPKPFPDFRLTEIYK
jgi:ectoine hydroxylase-related dioxygenase (phytanoyl-CoA dioxygenase family)